MTAQTAPAPDVPRDGVVPSPAAPRIDVHRAWTPPEVGRRRLDRFASDLVGVVRRTFAQLHDHDDAHLAGVGAQACASTRLLGAECNELNGGGSALDAQARAAAIGETVERYSVAWADTDAFVVATPDELARHDVRHVRPDELRLFAPWQLDDPAFGFVPFTGDTLLEWVVGRDLGDHRPRLVPARLVHMLDYATLSAPIGYATSNGLAAACTYEEAVLGGIGELLERDAFMCTWYGRLSMPRIDVDSDARLRDFFDRHIAPTGLDVALLDLSALVDLPVVLAVIRNEHTAVAPVALGAAASCDPVSACAKAVIEAFQTRTWAKAEQREGAVLDPADGYDQVRTFDDHVRMSVHPDAVPATRFLDAGAERVPLSALPAVRAATPGAAVEQIVARLAGQGVHVTGMDVTSPDVREGGMCVAKVFAPALSPLDSGYRHRYLGGRRLRRRAHEIGLLSAPLSDADLNPVPHPFP